MTDAGDTIVALSSGSLPSGVAIIRLSGASVREVLMSLAGGLPKPRHLVLKPLKLDAVILDTGLVAFFPAPHSFTGEDCAELQVHGSPAVVRSLLRGLTAFRGVRLAEAGEFTRRAFENGKLDLIEVEGLGDLIAAETESQRAQALGRMAGGLSEKLAAWRAQLLDLRAELEARLDFSDEGDVAEELPASWRRQVAGLRTDIGSLIEDVGYGRIIREGFRVALAGAPNAGKSSLLNALAKSDLAIVSAEEGTTRDVREVPLDIGGQLVIFVDMAGLRETDSLAEAEGVRRARSEIERADLILWLMAPDVEDRGIVPQSECPLWRIATKADLGSLETETDFTVSVKDGRGLDDLVAAIREMVLSASGGSLGNVLVSRERDRVALQAALDELSHLEDSLAQPELAAERLRLAADALARLTGHMDAEMVLDRLFAGFCIGK